MNMKNNKIVLCLGFALSSQLGLAESVTTTEIIEEKEKTGLPVIILGKCFKKETNLTVGSPSILLKNLLEEKGVDIYKFFDPYTDYEAPPLEQKAIYFLGTNHDCFQDYKFPDGSVVLNVWRMPLNHCGNYKNVKIGNSLRR